MGENTSDTVQIRIDEDNEGRIRALFNSVPDLGEVLVDGVRTLVPDPREWDITVSDDIGRTVGRLEGSDEAYKIDRGAGQVGAISIPRSGKGHHLVFSYAGLLSLPEGLETPAEILAGVRLSAAHLSRHEAGHAYLDRAGESAGSYSELPTEDPMLVACSHTLARYLDDHRIERYTSMHSPSPVSAAASLGDDIAHLRSALTESVQTWRQDISAAATKTMAAALSLIRKVAYAAAELGLDEAGQPNLPDDLPEGWQEYLESFWSHWSLAFHEAKPIGDSMSRSELQGVLAKLCALTPLWLQSIGIKWNIDAQGEEIHWMRLSY